MNKFFVIFFALCATNLIGQVSGLPQGVGAGQISYRAYKSVESFWDKSGDKKQHATDNDQNFLMPDLLNGDFGSDLQTLAKGITALDTTGSTSDLNIANISLGKIDIDNKTDINVKVLGLAYGLTDKIMIFAGIPLVDAKVKTKLDFVASENIQRLKDYFGTTLPSDFDEGLTELQNLNAATIRQQLSDDGYTLPENWAYKGVGDLQLGIQSGIEFEHPVGVMGLGYRAEITFPTGYENDPNILNDFSVSEFVHNGRVGLSIVPELKLSKKLQFYLDNTLTYNLGKKTIVRLPEKDETQPSEDRLTEVSFRQGLSIHSYLNVKSEWDAFYGEFRLGYLKDGAAKVEGELAGNYEALSAKSKYLAYYQKIKIGYQTQDMFKAKKFPVPFDLFIAYQSILSGNNANKLDFYEIGIRSYFPTPFMTSGSF